MVRADRLGQIRPIIASIRTGRTTRVHLRNASLGAGDLAQLFLALRDDAAVTDLDLSSNDLGASGAASLAAALSGHPALTTLSLSQCRIGTEGAESLAEVMRSCPCLRTIKFDRNALGADGLDCVARGIASSGARPGDDGGGDASYAAPQATVIGADPVPVQGGAPSKRTSLRVVDVSGNGGGSRGCIAVLSACAAVSGIAEVDVSRNGAADPALLRAVPPSLERLDVSGNALQSFPRDALSASLLWLGAAGNPWVDPPIAVMTAGASASSSSPRPGQFPAHAGGARSPRRSGARGAAGGAAAAAAAGAVDGARVVEAMRRYFATGEVPETPPEDVIASPRERAARLAGIATSPRRTPRKPLDTGRGRRHPAAGEDAGRDAGEDASRGPARSKKLAAAGESSRDRGDASRRKRAGGPGPTHGVRSGWGAEDAPQQARGRTSGDAAGAPVATTPVRPFAQRHTNTAGSSHPSRSLAAVTVNSEHRVSAREMKERRRRQQQQQQQQQQGQQGQERQGQGQTHRDRRGGDDDGSNRVSPWEASSDGPRTEAVPVHQISEQSRSQRKRDDRDDGASSSPRQELGRRRRDDHENGDAAEKDAAADDDSHDSRHAQGQHRPVQFRAPKIGHSERSPRSGREYSERRGERVAQISHPTPSQAWPSAQGAQDRSPRREHTAATSDLPPLMNEGGFPSGQVAATPMAPMDASSTSPFRSPAMDSGALLEVQDRMMQLETRVNETLTETARAAMLEERSRWSVAQLRRLEEEKTAAVQRAETLESKLRQTEIELARAKTLADTPRGSRSCVIQ